MNNSLPCPLQNKKLCDFFDMFSSRKVAIKYLKRASSIGSKWYPVFGVLITLVSVVSCGLNLLIIKEFFKVFRTSENRLKNWSLLSLTVADLGMCVFTFPQIIHAAFSRGWSLGPLACHLDATFGGLFASAQNFSVAVIAIDRYLCVKQKFGAIFQHTPKAVSFRVLIVWGIPVITSVLPFFGFGRHMLDGIFISCTFNYIEQDLSNTLYIFLLYLINVFAPIGIIAFSYLKIVQTHHEVAITGSVRSTSNQEQLRNREATLIKSTVKLIVCCLLTWTPYAIIALLMFFQVNVSGLASTVAVIFAKISTVTNASIYVVLHPDYKRHFSNYYKKLFSRDKQSSTSIQRSTTSHV